MSIRKPGRWARVCVGVLGAMLVMAVKMPGIFAYEGLDPNRTDVDPRIISGAIGVVAVAMTGLNVTYMYFREEAEILHLIMSSVFLPLLLICLFQG